MNTWASSKNYDCNFLCICVLGDAGAIRLAKEMGKQMKLTHCVNGFVDSEEDMPNYGQLGCSGFIILDEAHRAVSRSTSAFMEVRELAFRHVEALLGAVCDKRPLPAICPGEFVTLTEAPAGQEKLNGEPAICVSVQGDMLALALMGKRSRGRVVQVPSRSVEKLQDEDEDGEAQPNGGCGMGGCSSGGCSGGDCSMAGECGCGTGGCSAGGCDARSCDQAKQGAGCGMDGCRQGSCNEADCGMSCDSCREGGCDVPGCDGPGCEVDSSFVNTALDLVSVQVPSMDREHQECAVALRALATQRSQNALKAVLTCFVDHFSHEEALFEEFGFGNHKNEQFSAKKTHIEDHKRLLEKIRRQLEGPATVPAGFVRELLQDFHEHTSRYDVQYSDLLASSGAS